MNRLATIGLLLFSCAFVSPAQDNTITLDDEFLRSAEQWARENLDEDVLRVLDSVDREKIRKLLQDIQREFHGDYVLDLASLRGAAQAAVPLLAGYEETLPYALWLKSRLDYLDVAEQLRLLIPPPKATPGKAPKPLPNPSPQKEREIWIQKMVERPWPKPAQGYVPRLKPIFAAEKVPTQLVWVAEVESSFDPRARSPEGAAGMFQLMPATAKRFGLRTWPLDQRLKPETSARAAAQYLRSLHSRFHDWRLALAAYNAGEGTVESLLARRKARTFDAISTGLPAETQMFVPKIEATLLRREGVKLNQLEG